MSAWLCHVFNFHRPIVEQKKSGDLIRSTKLLSISSQHFGKRVFLEKGREIEQFSAICQLFLLRNFSIFFFVLIL